MQWIGKRIPQSSKNLQIGKWGICQKREWLVNCRRDIRYIIYHLVAYLVPSWIIFFLILWRYTEIWSEAFSSTNDSHHPNEMKNKLKANAQEFFICQLFQCMVSFRIGHRTRPIPCIATAIISKVWIKMLL